MIKFNKMQPREKPKSQKLASNQTAKDFKDIFVNNDRMRAIFRTNALKQHFHLRCEKKLKNHFFNLIFYEKKKFYGRTDGVEEGQLQTNVEKDHHGGADGCCADGTKGETKKTSDVVKFNTMASVLTDAEDGMMTGQQKNEMNQINVRLQERRPLEDTTEQWKEQLDAEFQYAFTAAAQKDLQHQQKKAKRKSVKGNKWQMMKSEEEIEAQQTAFAFNQAVMLMNEDLTEMEHTKFRDLLDNKRVFDELSYMLMDKLQKKSKYDSAKKYKSFNEFREEIVYVLKLIDVTMFRVLLNNEITLKQARARLDGMHQNFHYIVLDDLIDRLGTEVSEEQEVKKVKDRCQRSLDFKAPGTPPHMVKGNVPNFTKYAKPTEPRTPSKNHRSVPEFKGITAEMNRQAYREAKKIVKSLNPKMIEAITKGAPGYQLGTRALMNKTKSMPKLVRYHMDSYIQSSVPRQSRSRMKSSDHKEKLNQSGSLDTKKDLEEFLQKCCLYNRLYQDDETMMVWPSGLKEKYDKAIETSVEITKKCKPRPHELMQSQKRITLQGVETVSVPQESQREFGHDITPPTRVVPSPKAAHNIDYPSVQTQSDNGSAQKQIEQSLQPKMSQTIDERREFNVIENNIADPNNLSFAPNPTRTISSTKSAKRVALSKHLKSPKNRSKLSIESKPTSETGKATRMQGVGFDKFEEDSSIPSPKVKKDQELVKRNMLVNQNTLMMKSRQFQPLLIDKMFRDAYQPLIPTAVMGVQTIDQFSAGLKSSPKPIPDIQEESAQDTTFYPKVEHENSSPMTLHITKQNETDQNLSLVNMPREQTSEQNKDSQGHGTVASLPLSEILKPIPASLRRSEDETKNLATLVVGRDYSKQIKVNVPRESARAKGGRTMFSDQSAEQMKVMKEQMRERPASWHRSNLTKTFKPKQDARKSAVAKTRNYLPQKINSEEMHNLFQAFPGLQDQDAMMNEQMAYLKSDKTLSEMIMQQSKSNKDILIHNLRLFTENMSQPLLIKAQDTLMKPEMQPSMASMRAKVTKQITSSTNMGRQPQRVVQMRRNISHQTLAEDVSLTTPAVIAGKPNLHPRKISTDVQMMSDLKPVYRQSGFESSQQIDTMERVNKFESSQASLLFINNTMDRRVISAHPTKLNTSRQEKCETPAENLPEPRSTDQRNLASAFNSTRNRQSKNQSKDVFSPDTGNLVMEARLHLPKEEISELKKIYLPEHSSIIKTLESSQPKQAEKTPNFVQKPIRIREMKGRGLPAKDKMYSSMTHRTFPKRTNINQAMISRDKSKLSTVLRTSNMQISSKPKTARRLNVKPQMVVNTQASDDAATGQTSVTKSAKGITPLNTFEKVNIHGSFASRKMWTHRDSEVKIASITPRIVSNLMTPRSHLPGQEEPTHETQRTDLGSLFDHGQVKDSFQVHRPSRPSGDSNQPIVPQINRQVSIALSTETGIKSYKPRRRFNLFRSKSKGQAPNKVKEKEKPMYSRPGDPQIMVDTQRAPKQTTLTLHMVHPKDQETTMTPKSMTYEDENISQRFNNAGDRSFDSGGPTKPIYSSSNDKSLATNTVTKQAPILALDQVEILKTAVVGREGLASTVSNVKSSPATKLDYGFLSQLYNSRITGESMNQSGQDIEIADQLKRIIKDKDPVSIHGAEEDVQDVEEQTDIVDQVLRDTRQGSVSASEAMMHGSYMEKKSSRQGVFSHLQHTN